MKALSLRQPWAWLVVHGGKRVENRRWNTGFRGTFLVHAAKGMTSEEYDDAVLFTAFRFGLEAANTIPMPKSLARGGVIGMATLDGVLRPGTQDHATLFANRTTVDVRWHVEDQFGFVLRDVKSVPFFDCRGSLGFFDIILPDTHRSLVP